jgi:hypothetical protein
MPWSRRSERQYGMDGSTYPVSMSKICCAGSHFVKSRLSPLGGATIRQSDARWVAPRRRLGFKILALPIVQTVQQHPRDHIAMAQRLLRLDSTALSPLVRRWTQQSGINTLNRVYSRTVPLGIERLPRKCSMLPELRIGRYVLCGPILRVRRSPTGRRKPTCCKDVLHSTEPFLVYLREQAWKPILACRDMGRSTADTSGGMLVG